MERMVSVRLRDTGQNYLYNAHDLDVKENDYVIVEHDRGLDYGQVVSLKGDKAEAEGASAAQPKTQPAPVKRIIRIAKDSDRKQIEDNRARSKEAFGTCQKKIQEHKLEMKMVQAEYSFDRSKIIFYFTSGGRVDFRNLVKDLAKIFKARIELRQIGVRDETKFFGGYGPCGRQLCCSTFLKDFEPVTIKMAKEEGLPLNPPKISGICGRLMCCLNYEYETYKMLSKGLPREGERIVTPEGKGKVINVNVFKRSATVELEDGKFIEVAYKENVPGQPNSLPECVCPAKTDECPCAERTVRPDRPVGPPVRSSDRQERRPEHRGERPDNRAPRNDQRPGRDQRNDRRNDRPERGGGRDQRPEQRNDQPRGDQRPDQQRNDRNRPNRDGRPDRPWHRRPDRDRPRGPQQGGPQQGGQQQGGSQQPGVQPRPPKPTA